MDYASNAGERLSPLIRIDLDTGAVTVDAEALAALPPEVWDPLVDAVIADQAS